MKMQTWWLIDGQEIWSSMNMISEEELADRQESAKELSNGNMWWIENEPDLPRSPSYRHTSREDIWLNKIGK